MVKIRSLRNKGHRITTQRESVLQHIKLIPQTAEEIHAQINKQADLASVYRTLNLFVKNGIVRKVDFGDGKKRYELLDRQKHHHHFVCNNCKSIRDFSSKFESRLIAEIQSKANLKIEDHSIEFFGLCQNCL